MKTLQKLVSITRGKIMFACTAVFAFTGCSHYIVNDAGYVRPPKNFKFSYAKKITPIATTELIDTTVIYYLKDSYYYRNSKAYKNPDEFIRFYANGRFRMQGVKNSPTVEEVNNINSGLVGYYQLVGKVVKMQVYSDIDAGSDQLEFGLIDANGNLEVLHENPRSSLFIGLNFSEKGMRKKLNTSPFNPKSYRKLKVEGMTYTAPNW